MNRDTWMFRRIVVKLLVAIVKRLNHTDDVRAETNILMTADDYINRVTKDRPDE